MKQHVNPDGSTIMVPDSARIGQGASIGEHATIGERAVIGQYAVIGESAIIGERARIGYGARIGQVAVIGYGARIGYGASIGERASIGRGASIGYGAVIAPNSRRHAVRSDGYVFTVGERNGEKRVFAGCRDFNEKEARAHWGPKHKMHKETAFILNLVFMRAPRVRK